MRRLSDNRGIALVMALGILIVISISTVSLLTYTSNNVRTVRYGDARQKSSTVAEAGINEAVSILNQCVATPASCDILSSNALPPGSDTFDGGASASWSGTVNGDTWALTSTSTVKNPTGSADVHRTVKTQFRIGVDGVGSAPAWQFTYADSPSPSCMNLTQSAAIGVPFYIQGDLCLSNSANPTADEITVKGHITLLQTSKIGDSAKYISKLHTTGCSTSSSGPWTLANCTPANRVYANTVDSTFATVAKPTVDLAYWYAHAKPGPKTACTTSSGTPPTFDGNTVLDHSVAAQNILPGYSYSCTVTANGSTLGKLIWTYNGNNPGTLQIYGVIFIDGDLNINSGQAVYSGRGTIYSSGTITFANSMYMCGASNCDVNTWDGDSSMITMIAGCGDTPSGISAYCSQSDDVVAKNSAKFQGGVYAVTDVRQQQTALIEGPTISRQLYLENSSVAQKWPPIDFVSYGAPAPIGSTKLIPVSGSWSD
jgi:Tfp pilus assembly protein PilX